METTITFNNEFPPPFDKNYSLEERYPVVVHYIGDKFCHAHQEFNMISCSQHNLTTKQQNMYPLGKKLSVRRRETHNKNSCRNHEIQRFSLATEASNHFVTVDTCTY
jgi:hypothetical protein